MDPREAADLIRGAVPPEPGVWADLGAGRGTFTRALASLVGAGSRIYAVDQDARALAALERPASSAAVPIISVTADISRPFALPGLGATPLDGLLFANSLHYLKRPETVLERIALRLRPGGRVVIVEYDRRGPNRWVPYPIPVAQLPALAAAAGLSPPAITATHPSAFGGMLYVATAVRS